MQLHLQSNYNSARIDLLKRLEGDIAWAYVDSVGIPTFGIGLNLRDHGLLVLETLGFDLGGQKLVGTAFAAEQDFARQLIAAFTLTYSPSELENNQAKQAFDSILQARLAYFSQLGYDPTNFTSQQAYDDFQFELVGKYELRIDDSSVRDYLTTLSFDGYSTTDANGVTISFDGYEAVLDDWLVSTGLDLVRPELNFMDSNERLALLSLAYNSKPNPNTGLPNLLGSGLTSALLDDNRAEAWYQIRYLSNGGASASLS